MALMEQLAARAAALGVPLGVHIDLTWRCNERCIHCYLDHDDPAELTLGELRGLLDQMADSGVFFLTLSGGEIFLRKDLREIVAHARTRAFDIKLKTNAILIRERDAAWIRDLGVHQVQVSIYSHRAEVHDAITKVPGSLVRSVAALRMLREQGVRTVIACVLMTGNAGDYPGVQALAKELGSEFTMDPTITPHLNGDRSILSLNVDQARLGEVFRDSTLVGDVGKFLSPSAPVDDGVMEETPCSAGHTSCYVSPHGDIYPCVQFPVVCGNVREAGFEEIWRNSARMREVRAIRVKDLTTCSGCGHAGSCTRCPGLAYMEGNMYGPSSADCEKSFVRTGVPSAAMMAGRVGGKPSGLVQISAGCGPTAAHSG